MRVLLLGAGGMLARDLLATKPGGVTIIPAVRADLDITNAVAVASRVSAERPDLILNAAAYTAVDKAEQDSDATFRVNGEAVGELGRIAAQERIMVVHFSTDYVFDGSSGAPYPEDALTNPINVYGASKLAGEEALRRSSVEYLLIRTQWLFGVAGRSFPRTMWERATAGIPSRVVCDQVGRPTHTLDLAHATWRLISLKKEGIIHVANAGTATWYDVAKRVYSAANAANLLEPCSSAELPAAARRPVRSALDTTQLERILGGPLPCWEDAIDQFLTDLRALKTPSLSKPPGLT